MSGTLALPPPPLAPDTGPIADAALFLDFDGTLVEIAPTPDAVRVQPGLPRLLQRLATGLNGALAIVSGRPLRDLDRFLPVPIPKVGDHGATLRPVPGQPPESPDLPGAPAEWRERAAALVERFPGALIEDKEHGFVVHYRLAPAAGPVAKALLDELLAGAPDDAFTLLEARMAWEVRPRGASKGTAVRALMARAPFAGRRPVFIGDDVTDEEGMAAARGFGGLGLRLQDAFGEPEALREWLGRCAPAPPAPAEGDAPA
jgi:trehalose 6-phosphate phosphatase